MRSLAKVLGTLINPMSLQIASIGDTGQSQSGMSTTHDPATREKTNGRKTREIILVDIVAQ